MAQEFAYDTTPSAAALMAELWQLSNPEQKVVVRKIFPKMGEVGYQVVPVTMCPPAMPHRAKPKPNLAGLEVKTVVPVEARTDLQEVTLKLLQETKAYLGVEINGKLAWMGKSTLYRFEIKGDEVIITADVKLLKKRGL